MNPGVQGYFGFFMPVSVGLCLVMEQLHHALRQKGGCVHTWHRMHVM